MEKLTYQGPHKFGAVCGLDIHTRRGRPEVTLTELPENKGSSVANCFSELATKIYKNRLQGQCPNPKHVRWFCHYPPRNPWSQEGYMLEFSPKWSEQEERFSDVSWRSVRPKKSGVPQPENHFS